MTDKKKVQIKYYKTELLDFRKLTEFQGGLKELSKANFNKLWKQIIETGFSEPFVVWEDRNHTVNILNGHQRHRVLKEMALSGISVPEVPCNFIKCSSEFEAKKIILALTSQYGRITDETLYEFVIDNDIDFKILDENYELPNIKMERFIAGYFEEKETNVNENEPPGADKIERITCPHCGEDFILP